jgi:flavin reductase (DIM6/NTAB) family NADH-FMN oxidoreductase RutF
MRMAELDLQLRQRFLSGMSHAACTVNVVTTDGPAGRAGVTVSAMSSVTADTPKPALLVCVHHLSAAAEAIIANGAFCVNVLRDDQSYISDTFAGRLKTDSGDKFACAAWTTQATGAPRVVDPLVAFDCTVLSSQQIGTHYIFLGSVEDIFESDGGSPLIYANRAYGTPSRLEVSATDDAAPHQALRLGAFHTFGPYVVPEIVARLAEDGHPIDLRLLEGDQRRVVEALKAGEIDLALLYDFKLGADIDAERLDSLQPHVLLAEAHPLAVRPALSLDELAAEPLVLLDAPPSGDYFLSLFRDAGLEPHVRYRTTSFEMVRGLVGHGLGYSLLATKPASNMTYDGRALTTRPLSRETAASHLVLAKRANATLAPVAAAFAAECRSLFRRSPVSEALSA